jgi:hypothetical protein
MVPGERGEYGMRRLISLLAVACAAVCVVGAAFAASSPPRTTKQTVRDEIVAAIPGAPRKQDADRLRDAVKKLDDSLAPDLWVDDYRVDPKKGHQVFDREGDAVQKLIQIQNDKKSQFDDATLQGWIDDLVRADQEITKRARQDALANPGGHDAKKYDDSTIEFGKALQAYDPDNPELSEGKPEEAIRHLKNSWRLALDSIKKFS